MSGDKPRHYLGRNATVENLLGMAEHPWRARFKSLALRVWCFARRSPDRAPAVDESG